MIDIAHEQTVLRREALLRLLYQVWPKELGAGLLAEALPHDLRCTDDCLLRDLYYLKDRGLIVKCGAASRAGADIYALSVDGVDEVESAATNDAPRQHRMLRLRALQSLSWAGPAQPMGLRLMGRSLSEDTDLDLSEPSLRRAIAYLVARKLAVADGHDTYRITHMGMDYLAGDGDGVEGVARPLGW